MKNNHDEVLCSACGLCDETQLHLMQCKVINENYNENTHENGHEGHKYNVQGHKSNEKQNENLEESCT